MVFIAFACAFFRLRTMRAKRFLKIEHLPQISAAPTDEDSMTNTTMVSNKTGSEEEDEDKEEDEEEEEEVVSCDESDATHATGNRSEDVGYSFCFHSLVCSDEEAIVKIII